MTNHTMLFGAREDLAHAGGGDTLCVPRGGGETHEKGLDTGGVADLESPVLSSVLTPTVPQFINAANATYSRDYSLLPADLRPFEVDGKQLAQEVTGDGFYGAAFLTADDQVVVAFEGTHLSASGDDPAFVLGQIEANVQIYQGEAPAAYTDAVDFTQTVLQAAEAQGIGAADVFVTGHSLGGAEAEYVSAKLGLDGQTYGAPGIPAADIPGASQPLPTDYVEYGDPVGNYSAKPNFLGGFLSSDQILRFGDAAYIGDPFARAGLEVAGALFGPGTTPAQNTEGLGLLAGLAAEDHVLTQYAADLGVTLSDPGAYAGSGVDPAAVQQLISALGPLAHDGSIATSVFA